MMHVPKKEDNHRRAKHPRACFAIALEGEFAGEMAAGPGDIIVDVLFGDAHVRGGDLADDGHVTNLEAKIYI